MAKKKSPMKRSAPMKKSAAPKATTKKTASKKAAPLKKAAPRKKATKAVGKRIASSVAKQNTQGSVKKGAKAPLIDMPGSEHMEVPQRPVRSFLRQVQQPKPNELHPGQTAEQGATHDRPGSQPERVRHLYPNGNLPNNGSGRSTQYKGRHRDNGPKDQEG